MSSKSSPQEVFRALLKVASPSTLKSAIQYNLAIRRLNRRFGRPKPTGPFRTLGKVRAIDTHPRGALIRAENGQIEIYFVAPDVVRVRMRNDTQFDPPFSYAVIESEWPAVTVQHQDSVEQAIAQSDRVVCRIHKDPFRLVLETPDGHVISEDSEGMGWRDHEVKWMRRLPEQEWCYGLGLRAESFNLRGKRLSLWNEDPNPYHRGADPMYTSIPFYVGYQPDLAFGVLWDNPARGYIDLGCDNAKEMALFAEDGELRFYFMLGPTLQEVLKNYTQLTGRMSMPPMWALGFHQSRWGYDNEATFRKLAQEFRQRRMPCDVLYYDIDYMEGYRCFTWNSSRFPDLSGLISDLAKDGFRSVAIIDPGIKIDANYSVYTDGLQNDVYLKYPDGNRVVAPVWPGACNFPDFTNPQVRAWWGKHLTELIQVGFAGIWNDMNEPAVFTPRPPRTLPDFIQHNWENQGATHVAGGHNVYGMQMARSTREALEQQRPERRPFTMTRAAYAGSQRYCSSWTGDNHSTWDHLKLSISMALNMGLSGMSFTGPDIGGFAGTPDGELFTRWIQLGSMLPYFRVHSMAGTPAQEPWSYGEPYESIIRQSLEMRYQFLPYIYSTFAQCVQEGTPIVRPLLMVDPEDDMLRDLDDEFMLGDAVLVAPVLTPGTTQREVYLPRGVWYEYKTGKLVDGQRSVTANAPLDQMPVYIRAGKALPLWPTIQHVGEPIEEGRLRVYAGTGETTIYEDAGEGMAYKHGDYRWSYFTCKFLPTGHFGIEWRRAGKYQPPYQQIRVEVVGIPGEPETVQLDGQAAPVWYYEGGVVEFVVSPFGDARIGGRSRLKTTGTITRPPR
jgi:alpha-glucosidase